jgi:hypothetical protein
MMAIKIDTILGGCKVMPMTLKKSLMMGVMAEESSKTKKARAKLKTRMTSLEKKLTREALTQKSQEINQWISRHATDRLSVEKEMSLFDKNQNPAKPSRNVSKIQEELAQSLGKKAAKK